MLKFNRHYHPLTSRPYLSNSSYREYTPCEALKPYIACFWESELCRAQAKDPKLLVTPDTCTDIIIVINRTRQIVYGQLCGLDDQPMFVEQECNEDITKIAIRFYFWAFHLFFHVDMGEIVNQVWDIELIDPSIRWEWEPLFYMNSSMERITWVERYLLGKLTERENCTALYNSIDRIIETAGRASLKEICEYSCVGQRQVQRLFNKNIGLSAKRISCLVRYQHVWRDMVNGEMFSIQEAVSRYGYADQAHLLNEFKRFHGVSPKEAMRIALENR